MTTRTPSLAEVLTGAIEARLLDVHTAIPGRVEAYDSATQKADVKPLVKAQLRGTAVSVPVIPCVPVVFPGSGPFRVVFPVAVGDTVLLVFSERSLDSWLQFGGEVDPRDGRHHNLTDAVAIPGLRPFAAPLSDVPTDSVKVGYQGGDAQAEFKQTEIVLAGGTKGAARVDDAVAAGTTPATGMAAWIAAVTGFINGLGGTVAAPTDFGKISSGSTKVKVG